MTACTSISAWAYILHYKIHNKLDTQQATAYKYDYLFLIICFAVLASAIS